MKPKRLIACFDIIDGYVTKGLKFQDNVKIDKAEDVAKWVTKEGVDEIIVFDVTASAQKRPPDFAMVVRVSRELTVPFIVGGGIRNMDDVREMMKSGADKLSVDSIAVRNSSIISEAAREYGSGSVVLSMQVVRVNKTEQIPSGFEITIDGARVMTGKDAVEWAKEAERLGAGEICVNSVENDGVLGGYDLELTGAVADAVSVPVIASGGAGAPKHLIDVFTKTKAEAGIISSMLYSPRMERNYKVAEIKEALMNAGVSVNI